MKISVLAQFLAVMVLYFLAWMLALYLWFW